MRGEKRRTNQVDEHAGHGNHGADEPEDESETDRAGLADDRGRGGEDTGSDDLNRRFVG
jgi:hypothetical protein